MKQAARNSWKQLVGRIKEVNSSDAVIRMARSGRVGRVGGVGEGLSFVPSWSLTVVPLQVATTLSLN